MRFWPRGGSEGAKKSIALTSSDEPEPSWLQPELKLKYFQLGSARDHFASARTSFFQLENQKIAIFCCPEKKMELKKATYKKLFSTMKKGDF